MDGFIQVYTGDGKGKTTAAIGLAVRALGAGKKVYLGQFLKWNEYSEIKLLKNFDDIKIEQFGVPRKVSSDFVKKDYETAKDGWEAVKANISGGEFDLVILDEINVVLKNGLISSKEVLNLLDNGNPNCELILTGREALPEIIERAHLVTKMEKIKHYYDSGVKARVGIEL